MSIILQDFLTVPETTDEHASQIASLLQAQRPVFMSDDAYLACLAFGGTIQSAYDPSQETIIPVFMNPALERMTELSDFFGVADRNVTGATLLAKDSRAITNSDMLGLINTIKVIKNRRILITCGTYMLPIIAQILDRHFGSGKSQKIIGITGSVLPLSQAAQDADCNIGGAIAAIDALSTLERHGMVFAQFHGRFLTGSAIQTLDIHPQNYKSRLARASVTRY